MALFGKRSKKDKNSVDELADKADKLISVNEKDKSEDTDTEKKVEEVKNEVAAAVEGGKAKEKDKNNSAEPRRFTVLVEDAFQLKDNQGVVVGGNVHGTVNNHDKVYILHPILGDVFQAEIDGIEEGPMTMVETATDSRVGLKFTSVKERNQIPKYAVITNIRPLSKPSKEDPNAESPFLLGLCREYDRLIKEAAFQSIFTFAVFSSRYITPVKIEVDKNKSTEDKAVIRKDSKISFKLIRKPDDEDILALPVFTDYYELRRWDQAYIDNEQPQNFFMTFEQCAEIGLKNGGFVINPFSEDPVFVSKDNINHVLKTKADLDKRIAEEKKDKAENK